MFSLFNFSSIFPGGSADPFCRRYSFTFRHCKPLIIQDYCSWPYDKTYDTQSFVGAPSCDIFNLGSSYFHVPRTTVRRLLNVDGRWWLSGVLQGAGTGQAGRRRVLGVPADVQRLRVCHADSRRSGRRTAAQRRRQRSLTDTLDASVSHWGRSPAPLLSFPSTVKS